MWCKSNILDGCREGFTTSIRELARPRASSASTAGAFRLFAISERHAAVLTARARSPRLHSRHHDERLGGTRLVRGRASARRLFSRREARRRRGREARRGAHRPLPDASLHRRPRRRAVLGRGRGGPQPGVRSAAPRLSSSRPTRRSRSAISLPRRASPDGTSSPAIRVRTPNATVRLCSAFLARAFPLVFTF